MKNTLILLTVFVFFVSSCTKTIKKTTTTTTSSPFMSAVVGTDSFNANFVSVQRGTDSSFCIRGFGGTDTLHAPFPYLLIIFRPWSGVAGTYSFDTAIGVNHNFIEWVPSGAPDVNTAGQVVITSIDTAYISGTFHFTTLSGIVISNGAFKVRK